MNAKTRNSFVGIALLLIGLSLILAVNLTAPRTVHANPGVLYAAPTATGDVARYRFAQFGGAYTPITGGTVHGTGTIDDVNYNAVNIGFTFNYDGVGYTQVSINTNGFLRFGSASFTGSCGYTPISSSDTTCSNLVSALGMDLQGSTGGELRSETIGTAPNRVFVVQWKDFRYYGASGESFNFQVRLYETTNVVEFVYGAFTKNATSRSPEVGLKGATDADYNNRTGTNWATSAPGGSKWDTMTLSTTSLPASGQTYKWTPFSGVLLLYAAPTAQGSGDCSSWDNACTLQTALTGAVSGDEIWVKAGVHYPGAAGNREATFTLRNGVAIYGGFVGTETSRDQRNWQANKTILSGDIDKNDNHGGDYINENASQIVGNNAYHVITGDRVANAVLDGFVITAGRANGPSPHDGGGGMYIGYGSTPRLSNIIFSGNSSSYAGGGMQNIYGGNPTITNVIFVGNSSKYGGGMDNYFSSPTLINVIFSGNSASDSGGGMDNYGFSDPVLINVVFHGNTAAKSGGGIASFWYPKPRLTNVSFNGNSANEYGGGIYNYSNVETTLTNVIIWGDTAAISGDSIYNTNASVSTISYSDIQGCGGSSNWNSACGTDGGNNMDTDPFFVDAAGGNLRLRAGSPCIDAGNNAAVPPGITTDLDGNPRFNYTVDMGAYEYQHTAPGPRPFGKALPLNGNTSQPLSVILSWRASVLANRYEYCYDTVNNDACDTTWLTTTDTSVSVSGLNAGTSYYWQVRAVNNEGTTYADGGLWWSFTTAPSAPGFFNKSAPPNGITRTLVAPTLSWSASPGVERYEYCYDTTNDNACSDWISAGTATSVTLPGLLPDTTYYWQVRAVNSSGTTYANGSHTNFWSFTTYHLPGAFNKTSPADGSERENTVTLSWGTSSDAESYEYCYDTTDDNACTSWVSAGTNTSVTLSDLDPGATYYWQVRARNAGGFTYADGSGTAFWSFWVNLVRWDGSTDKPSPNQVWFWTDLRRTQWNRFRLKYYYEGYCLGVTNTFRLEFGADGPGDIVNSQFGESGATFAFTGQINSPTSASGTFAITNYRLVLQGRGGTCTVYLNDSGTWTTSRPLLRPGVFGKAEPANGATNQNTTLALWWDPSTDAAEYQYCLDTTDNNACDTNWISTGTTLGVDLSGLNENTTYYWQVRASNTVSTTYADYGTWWSFTTRDTIAPTVVSITRADASPTNAASVRFRVTFSEVVQNVDAGDFSLTATGLTGASIVGVSGSGATYTVTVSTGSGSGTLRLDIPTTATISDLSSNPLGGLPYTSGESYTVDRTAPTVVSITRADPSPTNAASVRFRVTFSEAVQDVDAGDFSPTATGLTGASVTGVTGSGTVYTITVSTGSGSGTLRLDIPTTATISDLAGNPLSGLPYTGGEVYQVGEFHRIFLPLVLRN